MSGKINRRTLLSAVGTTAAGMAVGFGLESVEATDSGVEGIEDLAITNNSDETETVRVRITEADGERTVYDREFALNGVNDPATTDKSDAQFKGTVTASAKAAGDYTVEVSVGEQVERETIRVDANGLPEDETLSVYVESDGSLSVYHLYA